MPTTDPDAPFRTSLESRPLPLEMTQAPKLDDSVRSGPVCSRRALLINPFYPKDPHASFGKHVLTPTLALTSIAGATPPHWDVMYWDENLLNGPPPLDPLPEEVGITVHLTFAERAYALARYYRERGSKPTPSSVIRPTCIDISYGRTLKPSESERVGYV